MPLIQVWECPKSGKLFKNKRDYREHLKGRAKASLRQRVVKRKFAALDDCFRELRRASDVDTIVEWLEAEENQETLWINAWMRDSFFSPEDIGEIDSTGFRLFDVRIERLHWEHIPNTHDAPLGKKTNGGWDRHANGLPTHYPGFRGRIQFRFKEPHSNPKHKSFNLKGTGIVTGTGGGGTGADGYPYRSYELCLFGDDWPCLAVAEKLRRAD